MPYVSGFDFDVFISYCHADNRNDWVTNFDEALKNRVRVLLGSEPEVWRDRRKLSGEHDFNEEIKRRLARSAILVLIVSPSYLRSKPCGEERQHFWDNANGGIKIGTRNKIVKVVKLPREDGMHNTIVKGSLGFTFFNNQPEQGPIEYFPGDRDFVLEIDHLAKGICNILREMSNSKTPVYVAEPPPTEAKAAWERLLAELESVGFDLLPSMRLDNSFDDETLLSFIKPAALSVHLLGPTFSKFSASQMRIAAAMKTSAVVWLPPDTKAEPPQEEFLSKLTGFRRLTILRSTPYWDLAKIVSEQLKPATVAPPAPAAARKSIYLICDRTNPADSEAAARLGGQIGTEEDMEVFLPEVDRDAAILDAQHQKRLGECDGVLLYWGRASKEWYAENYGDLVRAKRRLRAQTPFRSLAVLLDQPDDPEKNQVPSELAIRFQPPALDSIEPFLKPLRGA